MIAQQKNSVKAVVSLPEKGIVDTLIREYKKKRWAPNSERLGKPDSLSAWFSIGEMENFLTMARSHGGDGIRFYYGAYPENYEAKPEYAGRQMLIMVGTKTKITDTGAIANKDIYISKKGETELLCSFNPSGCPPTCNPPSEGGLGDLGITILDKGKNGMEII